MPFTVRRVPLAETRALRRDVLRPHNGIEQMRDSEPPHAVAFGAVATGSGELELVAVGLIGPDGEPGAWRIRGMATVPAARGRGAGGAVLGALITHATAAGARRIWCNARVPARTLYERHGMVCVSDVFELPEIGPHVVMELAVGAGAVPVTVPRPDSRPRP